MTKITIELPEAIYERLEAVIQKTVVETLQKHIAEIKMEPAKLTRQEVCKRLRVSLPTLRAMELSGKLLPQRFGKRVIYDERQIEKYLNQG